MRKITDEGFLFLYGAGLLVTAETGIPAVITILFACIYTCVNLVGEEKYLHYIMTIAFVAAGIVFKEMWMFLPAVLYNMLCFYSLVYIGGIGMIVAVDPADVDKTMEAMRAAGDTPYVVGKITEGEKGVTLC